MSERKTIDERCDEIAAMGDDIPWKERSVAIRRHLTEAVADARRGLYRAIEIDENCNTKEPVNFVGVHPLQWNKVDQPTVAFKEASYAEEES